MTSAGRIDERPADASFLLITAALRDEGTSRQYLPPGDSVAMDDHLRAALLATLAGIGVQSGTSWTTDAPFRETATAIDEARRLGAVAVEMEAAALYAFAQARRKPVVCLAHLTNKMAQLEGDFEKGEAQGSREALKVIVAVAQAVDRAKQERQYEQS